MGLFISNAPEQIGEGVGGAWKFAPAITKNLCKVSLPATKFTTNPISVAQVPPRIRVFLWHISCFTVPVTFAVLAHSEEQNGILSNLRVEARNMLVDDLSGIGMCLAAAHLAGSMEAEDFANGQPTLNILDEQVVWKATVPAGSQNPNEYQLLAAIIEFDIASAGQLKLRTVVSKQDGKWGEFDDNVCDARNNFDSNDSTHVRGYWKHANIELDLPGVFDVDPFGSGPDFVEWQFCDANGPEASIFAANTAFSIGAEQLDPNLKGATSNKGCYGVNRHYFGDVSNTSLGAPGKLYLGARARNIPDAYFGASVLREPPGPTRKCQPISGNATSQNPRAYDFTFDVGGWIIVPPLTTSLPWSITLATGGAAGTPANLIATREPIESTPIGGGLE